MKPLLVIIFICFLAASESFAQVKVHVNRFENQGDGTAEFVRTDEYVFSQHIDQPGEQGMHRFIVNFISMEGTIHLNNGQRVRLLGIDYVDYFAIRQYLSSLKGKAIWIAYDAQLYDDYGRLLAYVFTDQEGKVFVNAEIVRRGWALADDRYPSKLLDLFQAYQTL